MLNQTAEHQLSDYEVDVSYIQVISAIRASKCLPRPNDRLRTMSIFTTARGRFLP
jgi:hypothetical protein